MKKNQTGKTRFAIYCTEEDAAAIWAKLHKFCLKHETHLSASEFILCSLGVRKWPAKVNAEKNLSTESADTDCGSQQTAQC